MTDGFYWIQTHGTRGWTIARREGGFWDLIGTLHHLEDADIGKHFVIGERITPPTETPDCSGLQPIDP